LTKEKSYIGGVKNNQPYGLGFIMTQNKVTEVCSFSSGQLSGFCKFLDNDLNEQERKQFTYEGYFKDGNLNGFGIFLNKINNESFIGNFDEVNEFRIIEKYEKDYPLQ